MHPLSWQRPEPYEAVVAVRVDLPPTVQLVSITVRLYVSSAPVAAKCTLDDAGRLLQATLHQPSSFTFTARDLDGLPLDRGGARFDASLVRIGCDDGRCELAAADAGAAASSSKPTVEYTGSGKYAVQLVAGVLGDYAVRLTLDEMRLPFERHVRVICPPHQYSALASGGGCEVCPADSTRCGAPDALEMAATAGTTLATLDLLPNHWRLSSSTTDIHKCVRDANRPSSCVGGRDAGSYCTNGTSGPLCRVCSEPGEHFVVAEARCEQCPEISYAIGATYAAAIGICVAVALASALTTICLRKRLGALAAFAERRSLNAKLKIVIGFCQVVAAMPTGEWPRA